MTDSERASLIRRILLPAHGIALIDGEGAILQHEAIAEEMVEACE
jgi:hypothetical protein